MKAYIEKGVIVPCDFSEQSLQALRETISMVESADQVEVVHVTPYPSEPALVWGVLSEDSITTNLEKSFRKLAKESDLPDLKFTSLFGDPGTRICELARSRNIGLIVISSHGRTGVNRLLLGSVAERVVRLAPCPVLVLRADNEG